MESGSDDAAVTHIWLLLGTNCLDEGDGGDVQYDDGDQDDDGGVGGCDDNEDYEFSSSDDHSADDADDSCDDYDVADIDDDIDDDDEYDNRAAAIGQAGRNVPRESAPIITSVVNPRPPHIWSGLITFRILVMTIMIYKTFHGFSVITMKITKNHTARKPLIFGWHVDR